MEEIWRDVEGYEGIYKISNLGKVYSFITNKVIKNGSSKSGYYIVRLTKEKKVTNLLLHRLLAQMFIENKENLPVVNHKDMDKKNNNLDNLEWCTFQYNSLHARLNKEFLHTEKSINSSKKNIIQAIEHNKKAVLGFVNEELKYEFASINEAEEKLNICAETIGKCCNKKISKSAGKDKFGFPIVWRFKEDINLDVEYKVYENIKKVFGFVDNVLVYEFASAKIAYKHTNIPDSNIYACCNKKTGYITAGKYNGKPIVWRFEKECDKIIKIKPKLAIVGYVSNEIKFEFNSAIEAKRLAGFNNSKINKCCKGIIESWGKDENGNPIVWRYASDPLTTE